MLHSELMMELYRRFKRPALCLSEMSQVKMRLEKIFFNRYDIADFECECCFYIESSAKGLLIATKGVFFYATEAI